MWGNVQAGGYFDDQEVELIDDPRYLGQLEFYQAFKVRNDLNLFKIASVMNPRTTRL